MSLTVRGLSTVTPRVVAMDAVVRSVAGPWGTDDTRCSWSGGVLKLQRSGCSNSIVGVVWKRPNDAEIRLFVQPECLEGDLDSNDWVATPVCCLTPTSRMYAACHRGETVPFMGTILGGTAPTKIVWNSDDEDEDGTVQTLPAAPAVLDVHPEMLYRNLNSSQQHVVDRVYGAANKLLLLQLSLIHI
eukprot:TRINITY_DN26471_c0_g1_i1.p1 TRINITY_DN26471_c0_g1~~TRINITY_DN26471_c0_g1_i1.p1  ORF type:complete len:187 (-),score=37.07 TRINITY_DN26471_c0_g1_i1:168-728(-)